MDRDISLWWLLWESVDHVSSSNDISNSEVLNILQFFQLSSCSAIVKTFFIISALSSILLLIGGMQCCDFLFFLLLSTVNNHSFHFVKVFLIIVENYVCFLASYFPDNLELNYNASCWLPLCNFSSIALVSVYCFFIIVRHLYFYWDVFALR